MRLVAPSALRRCLTHRTTLAFLLLVAGCTAGRDELALRDRTIESVRESLHKSDESHRREGELRLACIVEGEALRRKVEGDLAALEAEKVASAKAAERLAALDARVASLRARLIEFRERFESIASAHGLQVGFRKGRLVLQLPADLVFAPGSVALKSGGKDALRAIGARIREDPALVDRTFLVAGHTDNSPYPFSLPYRDNWGLSVARARQVLLFLAGPATRPAQGPHPSELGGGVNSRRLVAVGYADTDPVAGTHEAQTREEAQKNRRVELILDASVEELQDLGPLP